MNNKELNIVDVKSLLQTNATILAGALIFLSLLRETFDLLTTASFLVGIYSIIISIAFCLLPGLKKPIKHPAYIEQARRYFCLSGLLFLFAAISFFLININVAWFF